jgi:hypothetical protein
MERSLCMRDYRVEREKICLLAVLFKANQIYPIRKTPKIAGNFDRRNV